MDINGTIASMASTSLSCRQMLLAVFCIIGVISSRVSTAAQVDIISGFQLQLPIKSQSDEQKQDAYASLSAPLTYNILADVPLSASTNTLQLPGSFRMSQVGDNLQWNSLSYIGHASGLYLSDAPPRPWRIRVLYFVAFISDAAPATSAYTKRKNHDLGGELSSLILMGSIARRNSSFTDSSCSSSQDVRQVEYEGDADAEFGALAVVGGTGRFGASRGHACVQLTYLHNAPIVRLSVCLHLINPARDS